ncbi:MAG: Uma2 family endonuclease [Myxacorys chilensis ATA2-1-KO14]|jgi:Uma2 family endonuclease|nr:Uma2 family endonuclease [Myxacorys chilensis ATA2-1-KO14]
MTTELLDKPTDQRITLYGTWQHFKLIQQGLEESHSARLSYLNGTIEILMPGEAHEIFSHVIGFLLTTFFIEKGIRFQATGAMDQEKEGEASAQADQSYRIGESKTAPDLYVVVFSSGNTKLAKYRVLGVPEVWFWEDGALALYHLRGDGYDRLNRSELPGLKDLDFALLKRCILIGETDLGEAVRQFRAEI